MLRIKPNALRAACAAAFSALTIVSTNAFAGYVTSRDGSIVHDRYGIAVTDRYGAPRQAELPVVAAVPVAVQPVAPASNAAPAPAQPEAFTEVEQEEVHARLVSEPHEIHGDILFGFDSASLGARAKGTLDTLARALAQSEDYGLAVVGHSDRIGTERAKQHVSLRRATTVRDYLAQRGVDPAKIALAADGDAVEVPGTAACHGLKGAKLKACLQPDRHVEVRATAWTPAVLIEDTVTDTIEPAAAIN